MPSWLNLDSALARARSASFARALGSFARRSRAAPRADASPSRTMIPPSPTTPGFFSRPESPPLVPGLLFRLAKLLHLAEGEPRVGVPVAPPNDLQVQEPSVFEVDVGEGAPVAVLGACSRVALQPHSLSLDHLAREGTGLLAVVLHGFVGVDCLRRVHSDQTDALAAIQYQRVAIDNTLNRLGLSTEGRQRCEGEADHEQQGHQYGASHRSRVLDQDLPSRQQG